MMISKVMLSTPAINAKKTINATPAFGLAKLNETGARTADSFGYQRNGFLNDRLFEKQGIFKKAAIAKELTEGKSFTDICTDYGCTAIGSANAKFIQTQILSKKGQAAVKNLSKDQVQAGLQKLYEHNYDNPELSTAETKALLNSIKESLDPITYVQNVGMLDVGTDK